MCIIVFSLLAPNSLAYWPPTVTPDDRFLSWSDQNSLGFYNRLFLVPKPNNRWRPILDLSTLNTFLNTELFKMETPRDNKNLHTARGVGHLHRLQGLASVFTSRPLQSPTLWSVHSTYGIHSGDQRGQTDGFTEGYKNPPVPRRVVGESHIPPNMSPAYTELGSPLPRTRLAGEQREVRTRSKTGFQLRRLPVRPQGGQGVFLITKLCFFRCLMSAVRRHAWFPLI